MYILFFSFLLSGIIGILSNVGFENIFRWLGLLILIFSFPFNFKWNSKYYYYLLFASGIYLVVLQLGGAFGIGQIDNYIKNYYPILNNLWNEESTFVGNINEYVEASSFKRFGGVFYNPNIMGQMIVFWYIIMRNFSVQTKQVTLLVFLLALVSILFTGSRTAFVVFFIYNLIFYWDIFKRYAFYFIMVAIGFFMSQFITSSSSAGFRIFNISQGITSSEGSSNIKYEILKRWFHDQTIPGNFDLQKFFFGNLNWDVDFDSDPGYILNYFGFAGAFFLLYFLFDTYRNSSSLGRLNFVLLLIGIGATVIMNFRFCILLFLTLSIGYNRVSLQKLKS